MMAVPAQDVDVPSDIHDLREREVAWDSYTFSGFYYDIDNDIGTETLTFRLSDIDQDWSRAILSDQPDADGNRGAVYTTEAVPVEFSYGSWGQYEEIGFLGDDYFAAYDCNATDDAESAGRSVPLLFDKSLNRNLISYEQISEILIDDDTKRVFNSSNPIELEEGYNLSIKSVDMDNNKVFVELTKNSQAVDDAVIQPSIENASIEDETYYYKKDLGDTKGIVIIAVHFENVFSNANNSIATIDGVFQISDTPTPVKIGQQFDKMSIRSVDPGTMTIVMDNKDNPMILYKNQDITLMDGIHIQTADQDYTSADDPLRYYLYYVEDL
jgi:S-layer protein (TIGR01567 family)